MRLLIPLILAAAAAAQDSHGWDSLSQLKPGDRVQVVLRSQKQVTGGFQSWTPEQIALSTTTAPRADVVKVERYREGGWSRGRKAAIGALIGFGGGFAVGAAIDNCKPGSIGPCFSRGEIGAATGAAGAVAGSIIGVLLPRHKELIYAAR